MGVTQYLQDYDGRFPYAIDPIDAADPAAWGKYPEFYAAIPKLPQMHTVLQPYLKSSALFRCPSDIGFLRPDFHQVLMNAYPSSYERYGTSYSYRSALAARQLNEGQIDKPSEINMLYDAVGHWHGTLFPLEPRYNVLFVDGHVKNVNGSQMDMMWATSLTVPNSSLP